MDGQTASMGGTPTRLQHLQKSGGMFACMPVGACGVLLRTQYSVVLCYGVDSEISKYKAISGVVEIRHWDQLWPMAVADSVKRGHDDEPTRVNGAIPSDSPSLSVSVSHSL